MSKKLIVANWKALPKTSGEAQEMLVRIDEWLGGQSERMMPDIVLCPPFVFLDEVATALTEGHLAQSASLGAQDIAMSESGAQTGEVSGTQLVASGVRYVIIGHSERRWKLGESEQIVNSKLKAALAAGLVPIVCLGERTREGEWPGRITSPTAFGRHAEQGLVALPGWQATLSAQTVATFRGMTPEQISRCIIAYEPVWAISTNPDAKPDTPAGAVQSLSLIRQTLGDHFNISHTAFLYGGSVTPANARDFLEREEFRGVLVGGASVRVNEFCEILSIAATREI